MNLSRSGRFKGKGVWPAMPGSAAGRSNENIGWNQWLVAIPSFASCFLYGLSGPGEGFWTSQQKRVLIFNQLLDSQTFTLFHPCTLILTVNQRASGPGFCKRHLGKNLWEISHLNMHLGSLDCFNWITKRHTQQSLEKTSRNIHKHDKENMFHCRTRNIKTHRHKETQQTSTKWYVSSNHPLPPSCSSTRRSQPLASYPADRLRVHLISPAISKNPSNSINGCGSKPKVSFWCWLPPHYSLFQRLLGCSLGYQGFDPQPYNI